MQMTDCESYTIGKYPNNEIMFLLALQVTKQTHEVISYLNAQIGVLNITAGCVYIKRVS